MLTDAELICLVVAQQLLGISSERRWIRYAHKHLRQTFPYLPGQSGYSKRVRSLGGLLSAVMGELARDVPSWHDTLRLLDSTPLPCAASRETVKRSDLAGHAGYGYCASHSRFFWGFRLYLITTPEGMPIIWGLANPKLHEREVTQALLERDHHLIRAGQVIVGDKGFAGKDFETFITDDLGAHLVRPDRKNEPKRFGKIARVWGSPEFVEGSLCCVRLNASGFVVDRRHHVYRRVAALVVVEPVAPVDDDCSGVVGVGEVVLGQHLPFQGGEERFRGGVVEA